MKNETHHNRFKLFLASLAFVLIIMLAIFIGATIIRNNQTSKVPKVIGVDVSAYQGTINWETIENQGIYFAYIKATEGNDYKDSEFDNNWNNINSTTLLKGAYLFYDFGKDGNSMADFFIKTVPVEARTLPPAIDVELTGEATTKLPNKDSVLKNVNKIIKKFKDTYHQNPLIYTNIKTYDTYFKGSHLDNVDFWICDISNDNPEIDIKDWKFWQFSWRGMLNGIDSDQKFIDLDVYNGNLKDFYNEYDSNAISRLFK